MGGGGAVLLGMRPALGLVQSCGQGSCERLEQLPGASSVVLPRVMGMKVPVGISLSQVFSGVLLVLLMMSQEVVPQRSLPVMTGQTGTSYDVSVGLP